MPSKLLRSDYDGAWKCALGSNLEALLLVFFPFLSAQIDWSRPARFLSQELKELGLSESTPDGRRVDFLIEVTLPHWPAPAHLSAPGGAERQRTRLFGAHLPDLPAHCRAAWPAGGHPGDPWPTLTPSGVRAAMSRSCWGAE